MEQKPLHYDGSAHMEFDEGASLVENDSLELTDEVRKNIGSNPYFFNKTE
ncbi:hypothetical protein [Bacillus weihaiensis]|nr:hypothetical protein [Bacillus weihaiensis]